MYIYIYVCVYIYICIPLPVASQLGGADIGQSFGLLARCHVLRSTLVRVTSAPPSQSLRSLGGPDIGLISLRMAP